MDKWNGDHGAYADFGDRIYDERLGRWMSSDRQASRGANVSPYAFCGNKPILYGDPDGEWKEIKITRYYNGKDGKLHVKNWYNVFQKTIKKDIEIIIHDAKIYLHTDTKILNKVPDINNEMYPDVEKIDISKSEQKNTAYLLQQDVQCLMDNTKLVNELGQEITITTKFAEPIEILDDLSDASYNDDLIILVKNIDDYFPEEKRDPTGLTISKNIMVLNYETLNFQFVHDGTALNTGGHEIYIHELFHQFLGDGGHKYINDNDTKPEVQFKVVDQLRKIKLKIFPSDSRNGLQRLKKESKQRSKLRAKMEQSTIPLKKGR